MGVVQGLFGTKLVHKVDSLVSVNRQHELYTKNPHASWLLPGDQVSPATTLLHTVGPHSLVQTML